MLKAVYESGIKGIAGIEIEFDGVNKDNKRVERI